MAHFAFVTGHLDAVIERKEAQWAIAFWALPIGVFPAIVVFWWLVTRRQCDTLVARYEYLPIHIYVLAYIITPMTPETVFNMLSDPTRLRCLMLIQSEGEVCVCELTHALQESQPKISRHLALMRDAGIVEARREGTWMHYRLEHSLPDWARQLVETSHEQLSDLATYRQDARRLTQMNNRPERICA